MCRDAGDSVDLGQRNVNYHAILDGATLGRDPAARRIRSMIAIPVAAE
jgi:hypothetical protein